ncbi:unnamed protein product [Gordionus sp. m RMFG-2023]|uniref:neutral alpha-glucosidase AB-like isoform X2 n=1 Tax=Gordionus sp. m RMFG-2023 TaxID=3053472 RepID=UPI0030E46AE7
MNSNFLFFILNFFLALTTAVDRKKFKTCSQSGFCSRQKSFIGNTHNYEILHETIKFVDNSLTFNIKNNLKNFILKSEIHIFKDNIIRILIEDALLRYKSKDSLLDILPEKYSNINYQRTDLQLLIHFNDFKIIIDFKPFKMFILQNKKHILVINGQNLFNYEQNAEDKDEEDDPLPNEVIKKNVEDDTDNDENEVKKNDVEKKNYQETFDVHTDTKPNGDTSVGVDITFLGSKHLYGIPEHADNFVLRSTVNDEPYRLYNFDVFEYELYNKMALYGSIPYMISHCSTQTIGIFWNNPSETWIDIKYANDNAFTHWFSETGVIDLFILLGPTPDKVFKQYSMITGVTPLPPISTLGYHQSRWNYNNQDDVADVLNKYDEYDIPLDFIWLDIEYTDGKKYFTWDTSNFPNPLKMIDYLKSKGRKLVIIIDPHIKVDSSYLIYNELNNRDKFFVQTKDRNDYEGWCWPGNSKYPDFARKDVRDWWASKFDFKEFNTTTEDVFLWNDMNEPSVFSGPEVTMPKDCLHLKDTVEHRSLHNLYALYVHNATFEGLYQRSNGKIRPFVLARGFFAGSQRTATVWTGDNTADWGHLKISIPMMLCLSVTGMTFSGADVGGFFRNPDEELLVRWYQAAAFQPFFRAHSHIDSKRREPYLLPQALESIRESIYERYTYIPYWYTLFYESENSGMPVMRPLWVEFSKEEKTFDIDNTHMIGDALLIHPVTDPGTIEVNMYFPGNNIWYNTYTGEEVHVKISNIHPVATKENICVFQRGGTIIPRKMRQRRSATISNDRDPYTLFVALNEQDYASGTLYIDDGISYDYKQGQYLYAKYEFFKDILSSKIINLQDFKPNTRIEKIVIRGIRHPKSIYYSSQKKSKIQLDLTFENNDKRELTIKNPVDDINSEWKIYFTF